MTLALILGEKKHPESALAPPAPPLPLPPDSAPLPPPPDSAPPPPAPNSASAKLPKLLSSSCWPIHPQN